MFLQMIGSLNTVPKGSNHKNITVSPKDSGKGYIHRLHQHLTVQNIPNCAIWNLAHGLQAKLLYSCFVCHGFDATSVNQEV